MVDVLSTKRTIIFSVILGICFVFLASWGRVVVEQNYILGEYRKVFKNLKVEDYSENGDLYTFTDTAFKYSKNQSYTFDNGVIETEAKVRVYTNSKLEIYDKEEFLIGEVEDIYNNLLVYLYSSYLYHGIIIPIAITSLIKYFALLAVGFFIIKIVIHIESRGGEVQRSLGLKLLIKLLPAVQLFPIFIYGMVQLYGYQKLSNLLFALSSLLLSYLFYKNKNRFKEGK